MCWSGVRYEFACRPRLRGCTAPDPDSALSADVSPRSSVSRPVMPMPSITHRRVHSTTRRSLAFERRLSPTDRIDVRKLRCILYRSSKLLSHRQGSGYTSYRGAQSLDHQWSQRNLNIVLGERFTSEYTPTGIAKLAMSARKLYNCDRAVSSKAPCAVTPQVQLINLGYRGESLRVAVYNQSTNIDSPSHHALRTIASDSRTF